MSAKDIAVTSDTLRAVARQVAEEAEAAAARDQERMWRESEASEVAELGGYVGRYIGVPMPPVEWYGPVAYEGGRRHPQVFIDGVRFRSRRPGLSAGVLACDHGHYVMGTISGGNQATALGLLGRLINQASDPCDECRHERERLVRERHDAEAGAARTDMGAMVTAATASEQLEQLIRRIVQDELEDRFGE